MNLRAVLLGERSCLFVFSIICCPLSHTQYHFYLSFVEEDCYETFAREIQTLEICWKTCHVFLFCLLKLYFAVFNCGGEGIGYQFCRLLGERACAFCVSLLLSLLILSIMFSFLECLTFDIRFTDFDREFVFFFSDKFKKEKVNTLFCILWNYGIVTDLIFAVSYISH